MFSTTRVIFQNICRRVVEDILIHISSSNIFLLYFSQCDLIDIAPLLVGIVSINKLTHAYLKWPNTAWLFK